MTGRLIVFEGIDGSGKSTQIRRFAQGLDFDVTFQFGATEVASKPHFNSGLRRWAVLSVRFSSIHPMIVSMIEPKHC